MPRLRPSEPTRTRFVDSSCILLPSQNLARCITLSLLNSDLNPSLRCCLVTRRRFLPANVRCVTVATGAGLLVLLELFFDRYRLWISRLSAVFVASRTRRDGHVRSQSPQRVGPRNVDVASSAFQHMLAFAAFVAEPC